MKVFIEDWRTGEMLKRCSKCGEYKSFDKYHKQTGSPKDINSRCKQCLTRRKYLNRQDRFWKFYASRTVRDGACIVWVGNKSMRGEPRITWDGKLTSVRRVVYKLSISEIPDDMYVITTCGRRDCVRSGHLRAATEDDVEVIRYNKTTDYLARRPPEKATGFIQTQRGANHHSALLNDDKVREIVGLIEGGYSYAEIGEKYGVHSNVIWRIARGETWKHITLGRDIRITQHHATHPA